MSIKLLMNLYDCPDLYFNVGGINMSLKYYYKFLNEAIYHLKEPI